MECSKCKETLVNPKESVKCSECASVYHATCSRIRTVAKLNRMAARDIAVWRCDNCKQETESVTSLPDSEEPSMFEVMKAIRVDIMKNSQETREGFASLKRDVAAVNTTLNSLQSKIISLENENTTLKGKCLKLEEVNTQLTKQVHSLHLDLGEIQQYTRANNIEIKGIPITKNENVYSLLDTVASVLKVENRGGDISIAHRLQQSRTQSQPPNIVVQFVSRYVKNEWIAAARRRHIQTTDIYKTFPPAPVYINDHLTAANKALLGRAKFLVKKAKLHAAWTRNGHILVRKTPDARTQRVNSLDEVCQVAGVPLTWAGENHDTPSGSATSSSKQ